MLNTVLERPMKSYNEAFLTGCDESTEWMLSWFIKNYKKHNNTPIIFADFGVSELTRKIVEANFHAIINMSDVKEIGWFKKPRSMLYAPSKKTVWLDTDCQVLDDISPIFNLLEKDKLSMVEDRPWSERRGEVWHNSGVVGFINKPPILHQWCREVNNNPVVGDQEVLHGMLNPITKIKYINDLPNEYNVMRIQIELDNYKGNKRIIHWTGRKGKIRIKQLMEEEMIQNV